MILVHSSNITGVGWTPSEINPALGTMQVLFRNGGLYEYLDVEHSVFQTMVESPSSGKFLNERIKPKNKFRKIEEKKK